MLWLDLWRKNVAITSLPRISQELDALTIPAQMSQSTCLLISPQYPILLRLAQLVKNPRIGLVAQNSSAFEWGAFTGEISAAQISDAAVSYSLVPYILSGTAGHDGAEDASKKIAILVKYGVFPIIAMRLSRSACQRPASALVEAMGAIRTLIEHGALVGAGCLVAILFERIPDSWNIAAKRELVAAVRQALQPIASRLSFELGHHNMPRADAQQTLRPEVPSICPRSSGIQVLIESPLDFSSMVSAISACLADGVVTSNVMTGYAAILQSLAVALSESHS